jgi:hypothetical protein
VTDEQLPVETERDAALFAKVVLGLCIGLLLIDVPEGLRNMIRAGTPVSEMAIRVVTGAAVWLLLGIGFIRLMGKLDRGRPPARHAGAVPDERKEPQAAAQSTTTSHEEPAPFQTWAVEVAADGALRIQRKAAWYRPRVIVCLVFALLAAGLIAAVLFLPGMPGRDQEVARWLCFAFISWALLYFLFLLMRYALEREDWRAGPNFLEVRRQLLGWERSRRYTNASLTMTSRYPVLQLILEMRGRKTVLAFSPLSGPAAENPEEFHALAMLLTAHTGWPPPYICPACGGTGREPAEDEPCRTCERRGRISWEELTDWLRRRAME